MICVTISGKLCVKFVMIAVALQLTRRFADTSAIRGSVAETIFDNIEELWRRALKAIETCQCAQGCPSCIKAGRRGREAGFKKSDAKTVLAVPCSECVARVKLAWMYRQMNYNTFVSYSFA